MVLGPFTDQVGPLMDDEELDQLETLLDEEDQYLYAWIIEKEPTPPEFDGPMLARIRAFMREHVAAEVVETVGGRLAVAERQLALDSPTRHHRSPPAGCVVPSRG